LINKIISTFFSRKRKSQYKVVFIIFELISKIYSRLMGFLEDTFYKNKKFQESFNKSGVFKFELAFNANSSIKNAEKIFMDESLSIYCLSEQDVKKLINKVFDRNTQSLIFKKTGFKYSIDYLRIYENNHISETNQLRKRIREAHYDKSFSRNMLKIFIPLNIDLNSGPLKVSFINSSNLSRVYEGDTTNCTFVTGKGESIYGVLPNLCWHQEGNPKEGSSSKQIMFQLNPSNRWEFREDLYLRQIRTENKFSSFSSFFFKKLNIN
jgi:hypothetical protein